MAATKTKARVVDATEESTPEPETPAQIVPFEPGLDNNAGTFALALMDDDQFMAQLAVMKKGRERVTRIKQELMELDVDYGVIPGTPKPTLFKPGAEKLALAYGLAARIEVTAYPGDGVTLPPIQYRAQCFLHLRSFEGPIVAVGHGTCNSWEKRYRRGGSRTCPSCGAAAIMKSRYNPGWYCNQKAGGCGTNFRRDDPTIEAPQNTNPKGEPVDQFDLDVTILKMAEKRAFVDGVLRATASSGLFTQDVAEEPADEQEYRDQKESTTDGGNVVDESGEVIRRDVRQSAQHANPRADMTGNPEEDHAAADEADPEFRSSNVSGIERGGRTGIANEEQVRQVGVNMRALGYNVYDLVSDALDLAIVSPKLPELAEGSKPTAEANTTVKEWLNNMPSDDIANLLRHLRDLEEARRA